MKRKIGLYAAGVLALAMVAHAGVIIYNATLVDNPALAYNNTYSLDLQSNGISALSAQATYSSATISNVTFVDGAQSTGSFTVSSYASLIAAPAVNRVTVVSTAGLSGATIILPGYVFTNGIDWATRDTASGTAVSIKNALATVPYLTVSSVGGVVYATAAATGSYYNGTSLTSSNGNVTVATPRFTGGLDNAVVTVNGVALRQGLNWTAATSNAVTATNIASAINASSLLNTKVVAGASGAVVTATSTINGALYNYMLRSSTPTALAASGANMVNGVTPEFTLGSSVITAAGGSNLSLALPVLYSGTPAIGGLTTQTTYYAVPVTGNSFRLSACSSCAVNGTDFMVITSTNTQLVTSQHTYTLAPLALAGTASFKWQVSNDNSNWFDLSVASVTVPANGYTAPSATTIWSFGYIGTRYIRLNVVAPTAGGLDLNVFVIGTN